MLRDSRDPSALSLVVLLAIAIPCKSFAADLLPQPDAPFKGQVAFGVKDSTPDWPQSIQAPEGAPNVVLILLDDVGFGAASTFGGPALTPALDQLSAQGLRYNRFHVTALCSPTRAALLSGRNDHRAGFGTTTELASGFPGYDGIWKSSAVTIADVLRRNGYSTAAFGKWHNTPPWEIGPAGPFDRWPTGLGFEYFYGFMGAEDSQWEPTLLYRNTTPVEPSTTPRQGYHFTTDITDEAIRWIHTHESIAAEQPYFLYFATGATHYPHQVPKEWVERYRGQFDQGWDKLREQIFARQKKLGVIPANAELTPRPEELPAWDSLSAGQRKLLARQMEVYAAFLAHTDHEVGRLLQTVQQGPEGDNTLILYIVGDNGGSGEGGLEGPKADTPMQTRLQHLDDLDVASDWFSHYASAWAWVTSTPFQWMKQVASHFGGTRDPLIVSWPARIRDRGRIRSQFTHVNDVAATLYEVTGIQFPSEVDGVKQQPLDGTSFAYSFDDPDAPSRHRMQIFEQLGNRAIYLDGWIAAARHSVPWIHHRNENFEQDPWELYHVDADFSQARNLATQYPNKLKELQSVFDAEARKNDIYPLGNLDFAPYFNKLRSPVAGKRKFVYYAGMPRLPEWMAPDFLQSHRITADAVIPVSGAEGVIIAKGARSSGFALYIKGGHLFYENNFGAGRDVIKSQAPLPHGRIVLAYEFIREEARSKKNAWWKATGTGRLYVNGEMVGETKQRVFWGRGSLGIGQAFGSPVSSAFASPFKFSGVLQQVTVELR